MEQMTFRITYLTPLCNGESMTSRYDFQAKSVSEAKRKLVLYTKKYHWEKYEDLPRLERIEAIR